MANVTTATGLVTIDGVQRTAANWWKYAAELSGAVNARSYGMSEDAADNFSAFASAMQASEKYLIIPPGTYTFTTANGNIWPLPDEKIVIGYGAKFLYNGANASYPFRLLTGSTTRKLLSIFGLEIDANNKANNAFIIYGQDGGVAMVQSDLALVDVTARNARLGVGFTTWSAFGINVYCGFENLFIRNSKVFNITREDTTGVGGNGVVHADCRQ